MATIEKIKLGSTSYDIVDATALHSYTEHGSGSFYLATYSDTPSTALGITPIAGDVLFMPLSSTDSSIVTRVYTGSAWTLVYSVYN